MSQTNSKKPQPDNIDKLEYLTITLTAIYEVVMGRPPLQALLLAIRKIRESKAKETDDES